MMSLFHVLITYMNIFSKHFADAELKDALIQSTIIAEGLVDRAFCAKMDNRGIRMYKLMYEALMRILLLHLEQQFNATPHIRKLKEIVT